MEEAEDEAESEMDSDALDEEDDEYGASGSKGKKRKSNGGGGALGKKVKSTPSGGGTKGNVRVEGYEDEDEDGGEEVELEEGQEIAGRIYPAPKTGQGGSDFWHTF